MPACTLTSFFKFISTVILDLKSLFLLLEQIGKANFQLGKRGTEVGCCFICKALMVWGYIQNLCVKKFYYAGFDLTNNQLTNTVLLDFQFCWVKFLSKNLSYRWIINGYFYCCFIGDVIAILGCIQFVWNTLACPRPVLEGNL